MNEQDVMTVSIELRRKLYEVLRDFWNEQKDATTEKVLFINSVVMSSLMA